VLSRGEHQDIDKNDDCVEIHQWLPWEWIKAPEEVCSYWCGKICETKTDEVCIQVPITKCELVGYAECTDHKEILQMRNDTFVTEDFQVTTCSPGPEVEFTGTKQVVNCVDRIQENCDTKWETDPVTKDKVWVGNVNCREVSVPDCSLEDKEVVEVVQTNDCKVTNTIQYKDRAVVTLNVSAITTTCEPKISSVCSTTSETVCTTVTWDQCTDSFVPWCHAFEVWNPHQEEDHRLRCPHDYTPDETTSIKPTPTTSIQPTPISSIQTTATTTLQTTATSTIASWATSTITSWTYTTATTSLQTTVIFSTNQNCTWDMDPLNMSYFWDCVTIRPTSTPTSWQSGSSGSVSSQSVSSGSTSSQSSSHSSSQTVSSGSVSSQSSSQAVSSHSSNSESSQSTNIFFETMDSIFGK